MVGGLRLGARAGSGLDIYASRVRWIWRFRTPERNMSENVSDPLGGVQTLGDLLHLKRSALQWYTPALADERFRLKRVQGPVPCQFRRRRWHSTGRAGIMQRPSRAGTPTMASVHLSWMERWEPRQAESGTTVAEPALRSTHEEPSVGSQRARTDR
jgi:hypothetical protein